jgi:MoxR-like ATPase
VAQPILHGHELLQLQGAVRDMVVAPTLVEKAVGWVQQSRPSQTTLDLVKQFVRWGAGSRGSQALITCACAHALLQGQLTPTEKDLRHVAHAVLRHRILLTYEAAAAGWTVTKLIDAILNA